MNLKSNKEVLNNNIHIERIGLSKEEFTEFITWVVAQEKLKFSEVQKKLMIGFHEAVSIVRHLEQLGVVGEPNGIEGRDILVSEEELKTILKQLIQ